MELKLENRPSAVLILAFVEALTVFIFNMVVMFVYIPTKKWLNFTLVITAVFWIVAMFIAYIGVQKRSQNG